MLAISIMLYTNYTVSSNTLERNRLYPPKRNNPVHQRYPPNRNISIPAATEALRACVNCSDPSTVTVSTSTRCHPCYRENTNVDGKLESRFLRSCRTMHCSPPICATSPVAEQKKKKQKLKTCLFEQRRTSCGAAVAFR